MADDLPLMFTRKDTPTIMDGLVVRYQLTTDAYDGEINASRNGVGILGRWPILSVEECVIVEEYIARARVQFLRLIEERGRLFGPHVEAMTEQEIDRILGPIPVYEEPS